MAEKKETKAKKQTQTKPVPKPRTNAGGRNSPVIGDNGLILNEGDNTRFLSVQVALLHMKKIDLRDEEQVEQRLDEYLNLYCTSDMKPTVAGMAIALNGHDRQWLWSLVHDKSYTNSGKLIDLPRECTDLIKKTYFMLENLWESYMNSGKINPVAGIFLGKNNYGYRDQVEHTVVAQAQKEDYSAADIREKYLDDAIPTDGETVK